MKKKYFLIWLIFPLVVFSQEKTTFSFIYNKTEITTILTDLENKFEVKFSYIDALLKDKKITVNFENAILKDILNNLELNSNLKFKKLNERYYIVKKQKKRTDIQQLDNVIIYNYLTKGISKNKDASFKILPKKLTLLPGLIEADILESIQQLPGVFSPNESATGLVIRGGTSDQNRIIWDNMNIYHNGHLFGMISAFNPNITQEVTIYNKGTNPMFGERISSVIDIKTTNKIAKKVKTSIGINGINTAIFLEIPILKNKLSLQTSARSSYTNIYESVTFNKLADKVFQSTKISETENTNNDFNFMDFNVKLNYKLNAKNDFSFSTLIIENNLDFVVKNKEDNKSFQDILDTKSESYAINWTKKQHDNVTHKINANVSKYRLNYNFTTRLDNEFSTNFQKENVIFDSNITLDSEIKTNNTDKLQIGYQFNLKDVKYSFEQTDDFIFTLDEDKTVVRTHSFYSNYHLVQPKFINVDLGFRVNYYSDLNQVKFEPRLVINKNIAKNLIFQVTGEIKNQIISQIDETILSDLSLENRLWRLANEKEFPIINSNQVSAGLIYQKNNWSFDIDYYRKKVTGLTTLSLGFLNPDGTSFLDGKQKINGIDFYTKRKFNAFNVWLSYSFITIKNKFEGLNNDTYFTASNEINHAVTTSVSYKYKKFQLALSFKWRNGKPFTKAITQDDGSVIFEGINTKNLEDYHRLDLSSTYNFKFSKKSNLNGKIGFSIRNIYNQNNQLSREYTGNNSLNDPIEFVDKFSLGFTPNFLFKVSW